MAILWSETLSLSEKKRWSYLYFSKKRQISEFSHWIFCYHENKKAAFLAENGIGKKSFSLGAEASSRLKFLQDSLILCSCVQNFSKLIVVDKDKYLFT